MNNCFNRTYRLLKTDEFSSVFSLCQCRSNAFFQICIRPNAFGHARLGLVVSKKVNKRAVKRNAIKRMVREWFRLNQKTLGSTDYVVRARFAYRDEHRLQARLELASLFSKHALCKRSSSS